MTTLLWKHIELTEPQKMELFLNGFVVIKNVVPLQMVETALRAINRELGKGIPFWFKNSFKLCIWLLQEWMKKMLQRQLNNRF